jgi:hypothetical protein
MRALTISLAMCLASACGGRRLSTPADGGGLADGGRPADGGGHEDGGVRDAIAEASSCPTVDTYCATGGAVCVRDWATAKEPSMWCTPATDSASPMPINSSELSVFMFPNCNGSDVLVLNGKDVTTTYFYDETTGALSGIGTGPSDPADDTTWSPTCVGGSLGLKAPGTFSLSGCVDGGFPFQICQVCMTCSRG